MPAVKYLDFSSLVSVVVATRESYSTKGGTIELVLRWLEVSEERPIQLVIAENSGDGFDRQRLLTHLDEYSYPFQIDVVLCDTNVGAARNKAADKALGDIIVFIDDDTIPIGSGMISNLATRSLSYSHGYGAVRYWTPFIGIDEQVKATLDKHIIARDHSKIMGCGCLPTGEIRFKDTEESEYLSRSFIGNFGFVRRNAFILVGGFPESFDGYGLEDDALMLMLYQEVGPPGILDDLSILHISHHSADLLKYGGEYNRSRYHQFYKRYGISNFHIGDLLFRRGGGRPVLVREDKDGV